MSALLAENARLSLHRHVKISIDGNCKLLYRLRTKHVNILKAEKLWRLSKQFETRVKCSTVIFFFNDENLNLPISLAFPQQESLLRRETLKHPQLAHTARGAIVF
jgi:hypothetical protein